MKQWGRVSLGKEKATNCSLMSITVATGTLCCWGLLRLPQDHASASPAQAQKSWGQLASSVGYGLPLQGCYHPLPQHFWGCSCLYLRSSSSERESFQGRLSQREERWGNWRLEALDMLETVHCSCQ